MLNAKRVYVAILLVVGLLGIVHANPEGAKKVSEQYTDNGDGTVTANKTGLIWQQKNDKKERNWKDATSYCGGLTLAGHSDWRLPSIYELTTLVDTSGTPSINTTFFPDTKSSYYWSSSTYADDTTVAWDVTFYSGYPGINGKTYAEYVRCVRGQ